VLVFFIGGGCFALLVFSFQFIFLSLSLSFWFLGMSVTLYIHVPESAMYRLFRSVRFGFQIQSIV